MITDYVIVEERRDGEDVIYQKVRFYEGDIVTKQELLDPTVGMEDVSQYSRTNMYEEVEYHYGK